MKLERHKNRHTMEVIDEEVGGGRRCKYSAEEVKYLRERSQVTRYFPGTFATCGPNLIVFRLFVWWILYFVFRHSILFTYVTSSHLT